jgi:hypothetical protein
MDSVSRGLSRIQEETEMTEVNAQVQDVEAIDKLWDANDVLLLRGALRAYPQGYWTLDGEEHWMTDELLHRRRLSRFAPPQLRLHQPVIWIGRQVYAATDLRESAAEPLLTLVRDRWYADSLDAELDGQDDQLWVARDGLTWKVDMLKTELTLHQRATPVVVEVLLDDNGDEVCSLAVRRDNVPIFALVNDLGKGQRALDTIATLRRQASAPRVRMASASEIVFWP